MPKPQSDAARWDERVARARLLAERYPAAADALLFYAEVAELQKLLLSEIPDALREQARAPDAPMLDALDLDRVAAGCPALCDLVRRVGPPALREAAQELAGRGPSGARRLLEEYRSAAGHGTAEVSPTNAFFAQALLQPFAERLALARWREPAHDAPFDAPSSCPLCAAAPQAGVLREDGQGARRSLLCSLCLTEWGYRRILCPSCGEERFDALPVYTADAFEHVRVEACESCRAYIKTVDLSKDGRAVPVVDELAAVALDLWAEGRGYRKVWPNLLGL
jgi:FdhE protein